MLKRLIHSCLIVLLFFSITGSVSAQSNYSFSMPEETVHVFWNDDGSIAVDYLFTFINDAGAHAIDFVDIGMPNGSYDWNSISADVNGNPLLISSDFQGMGSYGFAVDMGGYTIQPGQSGSLHVYVGRITNMYYPSTDQPETHASGQFSPTWFGSAYIHGSTNLSMNFHFPAGVQSTESIYYEPEGGWPCSAVPEGAIGSDNRIMYTWACPNASGSTQYTFGLSFPKQYIPEGSIVTPPAFDFGALLSTIFSNLSGICCFGFFILMFVGVPILGAVNQNKRKLQYLPPKISIEGHGIKRGLTAVEAAMLMEQPLEKVMTLLLFGVIKKQAAKVITREPLALEITNPLPDGLHEYEKEFCQAFVGKDDAGRRKALQEGIVKLISSVSEKMKGFSRRETVDYYKAIMERAWNQIETAGTPEIKSEMYEQALEWTMLDKNYDDRTRRVFPGNVYVPTWWGNYDPTYRRSVLPTAGLGTSKTAAPSLSTGRSQMSVPGAAFAASVVNNVQGFSSRTLGDIKAFTSGVTNRTNPIPKSTSAGKGSSGGGGGRSCACACACAGCACACAGGGR